MGSVLEKRALAAIVGIAGAIAVGLVGIVGLVAASVATADASQLTCDGKPVTILGTAGSETLEGTDGDDVILGLGGNDTINGKGGDDTICAGDGDDAISAGVGRDRVFAGDGIDYVFGGDGIDYVWGGAGADVLEGEGGSDRLRGGTGNDVIRGGSGADRIWGSWGDDEVFGQGGQDQIWGGPGDDVLQGNWQSDQIWGGDGSDTIGGAEGKDLLYGGNGLDTLTGGPNTDQLFGGRGVDTLSGGPGTDTLTGGTEPDLLSGGPHTDICFRGSYDALISCQERQWDPSDRWTLIEITNDGVTTAVAPQRAILELDASMSWGFVSGPCVSNEFTFALDAESFAVAISDVSQFYCEGADRELEELLFSGVDQADRLTGGSNVLTLTGPTTTLRFQRVGAQPASGPVGANPLAILQAIELVVAPTGSEAQQTIDSGSIDTTADLPTVTASVSTFADADTPIVVGGTQYSVDWQIFSLTTGALIESTYLIYPDGSLPVYTIGNGEQPKALEAAMLGRPIESDYVLIYPLGMEDIPANLATDDAYVVYVQIYQYIDG